MPKLLYIVACEKVIFDMQDNTASLITLMEGVRVAVDADLPEDAEMPLVWSVYSMWRKEVGEGDREFEQRVEMISPAGKVVKRYDARFKFVDGKNNHRVKTTVVGLPIGEDGEWSIKLSLRRKAEKSEWDDVASLPFEIDHIGPKNEKPTV